VPEIRAAGFVLYRREAERNRYLLLVNARRGEPGSPKGHAEEGETDLEAALRETAEETGLESARLAVHGPFRREISYPVKRGDKRVVYFAARTDGGPIRLSKEHSESRWVDLDEVLAEIPHANLREVYREAAVWLKDPIFRRGLTPDDARALLETEAGDGARVVAHTAQVAAMAGALAGACPGMDAAYVEAAAWLHDLGRSRSNGLRHTVEGFRLACARGWPGYAPTCISHYTKGSRPAELGVDPVLAAEMDASCDLGTFEPEECWVALADAMAIGDRRGRIEERVADLVARYGPSPFFTRYRETAEGLRARWEAAAGRPLYDWLGIA